MVGVIARPVPAPGAPHGPLAGLEGLVPPARLLTRAGQVAPFESDALTSFRTRPAAVVLVDRVDEVAPIVRALFAARVPFVARGSGTSLSGGSLPVEGGVVLALNRLRGVIRLDPADAVAEVECGVVNAEVSRLAAPHGLHFAPDPSSGTVCTVGGNVAFNSGGAHCLRYGMTANHVLGLEVVLPDGATDTLGGGSLEFVGPDLVGAFVGSEGLFGVATSATLRLVPRPERVGTVLAAYASLEAAGEAVARVVAAGLLPGAMEIMDRLAMDAAEASVGAGYPTEAAALVIVEVEGPTEEVAADLEATVALLHASGATEVVTARDDADRARVWKGRKGAFSAVGRLSPDYLVQDGVVPRTQLGAALAAIERLGREGGLRVANVFHAGDGNLHPLILFDGREAGALERAERLAGDILRVCVSLGGSITGEHGVGVEKRDYLPIMFDDATIGAMRRLHRAVDERGIANPGKVFPPEAGEAGPGAAAAPRTGSAAPRPPLPWRGRVADEVEALRDLLASGERVHVRGGGTKPALSAGANVHLEDVRGIVDYEPAEYTVTALAGTRVAQLAATLAEHGQELPFDPPLGDQGATVGGTVAAGVSGPGRLRSGGVRDFLLAVRFLTGDGTLVTGGARVVKNAAGFDLPKLLVGSLGRLGVLLECTFKVFPRPEARATLRLDLADAASARSAMTWLATGPFELAALELEPPARLWVRIAGRERTLPDRIDRLCRAARSGAAAEVEVLVGPADEGVWRHARSFAFVPTDHALVKLPAAPSRLADLDARLEAAGAPVPRRHGVGGHVTHLAWPDELGPEALDRLVVAVGSPALALSGRWDEPLRRTRPRGAFEERLQRALDPHGLLGPRGGGGARRAA